LKPIIRWNHRPEEEGITTIAAPAHHEPAVGITALKKKGLRPTLAGSAAGETSVGITALKKKGLRHRPRVSIKETAAVGITALKKKGLRPSPLDWLLGSGGWNHRPEEEGITTLRTVNARAQTSWNHRPEEEGITTKPIGAYEWKDAVGITALKKKGLRLGVEGLALG